MGKPKGVKAPSGVTVTRNGNKYTVTWKLGAKNYTAQELYYKINGEGSRIDGPSVGKKDTSKVATVDKNTFYPKTDVKASKLTFIVRGGVGKKNKKPKWSAEAPKDYGIAQPLKPQLTANFSTEHENSTTFSWSLDWGESNAAESTAMFTNFKWWSVLLKDSNLEPSEVTDWPDTGETGDNVESGSKTYNETQVFTDNYSYTRFFMVKARGPFGDSDPVYAKHVYAFPNAAKNVKATATKLAGNAGTRVSVEWTADSTKARPIDSISVEYAVETPASSYTDDTTKGIRKTTLSVPTISNWTSAATVTDTTDAKGDVDGVSFVVNDAIPVDKCIFVRVVTKHDNKTTPSATVFVKGGYGELTAPKSLAASVSGHVANITVNNSSAVTASFVGLYYRSDISPTPKLIGIYAAGQTTASSVQFPDEPSANSVSFGARTFVGDYSPITPKSSGVTEFAVSRIDMESNGIVWDDRPVPKPPTKINLSSPRTGVVRMSWDWSWTEATGVELSWADHDDAWESTDGPQTHVLENTRASAWNIAGLAVGEWFFRVRLFKVDGDATTYGTYSAIFSTKVVSSPATPVLTVSPAIVPPDGSVTCYWSFAATDGDEQVQADICKATLNSSGVVSYGPPIAHAAGEQFKTLKVKDDLNWSSGGPYYLAVRIVTASGEESGDWSVPKPVRVLNPITATVNSSSLHVITVVDDEAQSITRQVLSLTEMSDDNPFDVSASGAGENGEITYIIERADDYHVDRPDETDFTGYKGETIAVIRQEPKNTSGGAANYDVSITNKDLIGSLDDGAKYNLVVIAKNSYGQVSKPNITYFEVHWAHQAVEPSATIQVDEEELVTVITPIQPSSGYASGDTCDIYRLSADRPELIVQGAQFDIPYVDPYPALGSMGGHRIVYKTINGDYITADNEFAWVDYDSEDGNTQHTFATIIDFGDDRAILPYDISISNKWSKDFTQTKYLGGSVQGDWNPAVERTGSVNTRVSVQDDPDLIETMRRLATYAGICHVRTPDGSSFAANVNVSEDREERKINMVASFSLDITRVDSAGFDGMTKADWDKGDD